MDILLAGKSDVEEILELQKKAFLLEAKKINNLDIEPLKETIEEINNEFASMIFYKAVLNNKIIGSVRGQLIDDVMHIGKLIVDPLFQKNGIGTALLKRIENDFKEYRKELFTSSASQNNIEFYKKKDTKCLKKNKYLRY